MGGKQGAVLDRARVPELRSCVLGEVLLPGDEGYDAERVGWNLLADHRPGVIVVAAIPEDVVAAVRFAAAEALPVAVQATGHGTAMVAEGGMLIVTRYMDTLTFAPGARRARIGAGAKWGKLLDAAGLYGLAPLVGSSPDVGAVGYLTGGGLPVLGRRYGFAADHVSSLELVTPDGRLRHVTESTHPDLFWAVRGGKGNFGVVTAVEVDLQPLARFYGGGMFFPGSACAEVLRTWVAWTASQPDEMSTSVALARFSDLPVVPEPVRGTFMVHLRVAYTGTAEQGARLIAPLRALEPVVDTVTERPYTSIGEVHRDPVDPVPVRDRGVLLRDLDDAAVDRLVAVAGPEVQLPPGVVEIRHLGGALARPPQTPHAAGPRDARFLFVAGHVSTREQLAQVDHLQQTLIAALDPWGGVGTLPNFLGAVDTSPEQVLAAYRPADHERLAAIKAAYDPDNLFGASHNIRPAARGA